MPQLCSMVTASLVVLVIQNSMLVIMTRFSLSDVRAEEQYHTSTLILNQEIVKMMVCLILFAYDRPPAKSVQEVACIAEDVAGGIKGDSRELTNADAEQKTTVDIGDDDERPALPTWRQRCVMYCRRLRVAIFKRDTLLLLVPAALFTVQNFLLFIGLRNLSAMSFQIWSQSKLLSAAVFSVLLLHRQLSFPQWISLAVLSFGVLVTQLSGPKKSDRLAAAGGAAIVPSTAAPYDDDDERHALLGITACLISSLSSSYAGVYFEKVVKTTSPTLAIRNIQLSLFGIPLAFLSMLLLDVLPNWRSQHHCGQHHFNIFAAPPQLLSADELRDPLYIGACPVEPFYFWQGYQSWLTWGLVGIHALGGLLVALVVKYADNIVKGFATGIAVIVSGVMTSMIWGYRPTLGFVVGAMLVTVSTVLFHHYDHKK